MLATKVSKIISRSRYNTTGGICARLLVAQQYGLQERSYHVTSRDENALLIGGFSVAITAIGLQYAVGWYNGRPKTTTVESPEADTEADTSSASSAEKSSSKPRPNTGADAAKGSEPFYAKWFTKKYYDGGFEDKMTKREAALILGVRESATSERINDNYRKILLLNHPDRGGSAYMAAKINEAKVMLLKGK